MSAPIKDIMDLYDQAAAKAKAGLPAGWGVHVRVKIADREVETTTIAPPAAARGYPQQQQKGVPKEELKKWLLDYQDRALEVKETDTEFIIRPTARIGDDWGKMNEELKKMSGVNRVWFKDEKDPMQSCWRLKKA